MNPLEQFNEWWRENSYERMEFNLDPYGIDQALHVYTTLFDQRLDELVDCYLKVTEDIV